MRVHCKACLSNSILNTKALSQEPCPVCSAQGCLEELRDIRYYGYPALKVYVVYGTIGFGKSKESIVIANYPLLNGNREDELKVREKIESDFYGIKLMDIYE